MWVKISIIMIWLLAFTILNVQSKRLVESVPSFQEGLSALVGSALGSYHLYLILILYGSCAVLYLVSLRMMPLTVAGPVFTMAGTVMTFLLGVFWFGESVSTVKLAGLGFCLAGVILLFTQG